MSDHSKDGPEPVCAYGPASPLMDSWRAREPVPLVTLRCGRGKRSCRRALVVIFDSPRGALVRFFRGYPDMPMRLSSEAAEAMGERIKGYDPEGGTALQRGRKDDRGTVVALEDDHYWHDIVHPGCPQHGNAVEMSRADLMTYVRHARQGRRVDVTMRYSS